MSIDELSELSDEQAMRLGAWRTDWLGVVTSTAAADRPRAEAAIARIYEDHGAQGPVFVWVRSPAEGLFAIAALASWKALLAAQGRFGAGIGELLDPPWDRGLACDALPDALARRLGTELGAPIRRAQAMDPIWAEISTGWRPSGALAAALARQVGLDEEGTGVCERALQAWRAVRDDIWRFRDSEVASPWIERFVWARPEPEVARYTFARSLLPDRNPEIDLPNLGPWEHVARAAGMWWPLRGICVASERPVAAHHDAEGRLHHPARAASQFSDGFCVYAWHGTSVPEDWILAPERVDPTLALRWDDIEQRRALAEIVGWSRVLERLSVRVIDRSDDRAIGELIEVRLPPDRKYLEHYDGELGTCYTKAEPVPARFLRVRCGTGREFVLSVPLAMRTAREANAWTYGLGPDQYELEART